MKVQIRLAMWSLASAMTFGHYAVPAFAQDRAGEDIQKLAGDRSHRLAHQEG